MRIDRKMNLVIPVDRGDGSTVYVYSIPIGRDVFETHFEILSLTFSRLISRGHYVTAPSISYMMLKRVAQEMGQWNTENGIDRTLWAEIRRLTTVLAPSENGYSPFPFDHAIKVGVLNEDDVGEIENLLAFFTLISHLVKKDRRNEMEDGLKLWGGQLISQDFTAFKNSLLTSKSNDSSGETVTTS